MSTKYFVEIMASNKHQLINLQKFELDLFPPTVKKDDNKNKFTIEGLITLDEVNKLVENGYKVFVKKEAIKKTPATEEVVPFQNIIEKREQSFREDKKKEAKTESDTSLLLSMPPSFDGYLSSEGIDSALQYIAKSYPEITELIVMPEKTHEKRTCKLIKIGKKNSTSKNGILFLGGVHAREILNPDLLVKLSLELCHAYTSKTGLAFGGKLYENNDIRQIVETTELYIFPLVNPDGRSFVQSPTGDVWWRKNRNANPGLQAQGVDLNRNYDFLWDSGIGTSTNPTKDIYRGASSNSEPETKNVIHVINKYQNIRCLVDVHSYSELILYPWGDDENQTTDPDMNFRNSDYDGYRGHPEDSIYKEYIYKKDLDWYEMVGKKMRDSIASVRGKVYEVQPSMNLYPTSGTCHDYVYTLRYNGANRHIMGFTIETANRFQPPYSEAINVMSEVSAGLMEACLEYSDTIEV